ncbi:GDP-mannose 4,6-dehydratase [Denitrificimonas caeni]|uniref:GDP-mannose 4,6-dehydratase n=1 Tax=Denitrificimonas caeni TaxID=521720 RepID=UPI0003B3BCA1|nr:GDP-mannose 4,6-dehydratase [Denitrificimonas caeni]
MIKIKILLTGANGFVGQTLSKLIDRQRYTVTLAISSDSSLLSTAEADQIVSLDMRNEHALMTLIQILQPDVVIHLAAISHVPTSFSLPVLTWQTNVLGTVNMLEALHKYAPQAFLLFVSSSEVYGEAFKCNQPLAEDSPCQPMNPYAASKLAAELACQQYFKQGLQGVIARPFNHIGPGQSEAFVTAAFAKQIAAIEQGLQTPTLQVGNLSASRDFLDVRDVCAAYLALIDLRNTPLEQRIFNIASGVPCSIQEVLDTLQSLSSTSIHIALDPQRLRPSDIPFAVGNSQRLRATTHWQPQHTLATALQSLLDDWREKLAFQQ